MTLIRIFVLPVTTWLPVLGAVGILPMNKLIREDYMKNTLQWIWDNWN